MKWERETRKRLTNKRCIGKKEKICGTIIYSSTYLVQVKFDNDVVKNYSYTQFLNEFEVESTKKIVEKKKERPFDKKLARRIVIDYLNKQYPTYIIKFEKTKRADEKVWLGDMFCGYIQIKDSIKISYFVRMPNPLLAKYQCRWRNKSKLNLNYEFTDLNSDTISDLRICLNELIFAHTYNK